MSALGQNSTCTSVQAMSALTPISDIGRHACYRCELGASARHKAANLSVAVTVVIGPHDGTAETVGFGYNCRVRVPQTIARKFVHDSGPPVGPNRHPEHSQSRPFSPSEPIDDRGLVHTHVARRDPADKLVIQLAEASTLEVPRQTTPARRRREILLPEGNPPGACSPDPFGDAGEIGDSACPWPSLA